MPRRRPSDQRSAKSGSGDMLLYKRVRGILEETPSLKATEVCTQLCGTFPEYRRFKGIAVNVEKGKLISLWPNLFQSLIITRKKAFNEIQEEDDEGFLSDDSMDEPLPSSIQLVEHKVEQNYNFQHLQCKS
jgi:hypothetical protein